MPKIYISPSNQGSNMCLNGDSEKTHCNLLVDAMIPYLNLCGIEYERAGKDETLEKRVKNSNKYKPDIHYCIHTNAGGGSRSVLYGYNKDAEKWLKLANAIKDRRALIYPREIRFVSKPSFYEIKNTTAICMYDEVIFHDNIADVEFFHNNIDSIAREIVHSLCDYFSIPFIDVYTSERALEDIKCILERYYK